jgi:hypothetical protein
VDLVSAPTDDASERSAVLLPHGEYRALLEIDGQRYGAGDTPAIQGCAR